MLRDIGSPTPTYYRVTPTGAPPPPRSGHTSVYDPITNRMIVFGGSQSDYSAHNDVWVLNNANGQGSVPSWMRLDAAGTPPPPRVGASAIYDASLDRMTVFGGGTGYLGHDFNDVWVLLNTRTNPTWVQITPANTSPSTRSLVTLVYTPASKIMTLFGGFFDLSDTWIMKNPTGVDTTVTTNPPGLPFAVDDVTSTTPQTFIWGGYTTHTLSVKTPPPGTSTRLVFSNWSDGGGQTHGILGPSDPTTFTANFTTQHLLTFPASLPGGTISASPSSRGGFYDNGTFACTLCLARPPTCQRLLEAHPST
jgi:hypothetical protein